MPFDPIDCEFMKQAIQLAAAGEGFVEPNPMVGCILVRDGEIIGKGWHEKFGGPHAEVNALECCPNPKGSTAYVTLEPCCHQGKTGPCTDALIDADVERVVLAVADPFTEVAGRGIEQLKAAGIQVDVGVEQHAATELIRPYLKKIRRGIPWVIAKWAMTLDGKISTVTGKSKWISNEKSRAIVHGIRGRVDAIVAGIGTVLADDPLLNARPPGARTALRVVVDPQADIPLDSNLVTTAEEFPLAIAVSHSADPTKTHSLTDAGCQIIRTDSTTHVGQLRQLLQKLGELNFTNVLIEGGSSIFGALNDGELIDEIHAFVAPKVFGGSSSTTAVAGNGISNIGDGRPISILSTQQIESDIYIIARTNAEI